MPPDPSVPQDALDELRRKCCPDCSHAAAAAPDDEPEPNEPRPWRCGLTFAHDPHLWGPTGEALRCPGRDGPPPAPVEPTEGEA